MYFKLELSTFIFKNNPNDTDYHSWVFSENDFLKLHSYKFTPESQKYFRFNVSENLYDKKSTNNEPQYSTPILDGWFSINSAFGELRDLQKGQVMTGNEVMGLFDFFNQNVFKIDTIYLCDASRSDGNAKENAKGQILFRVPMSIAYGKTWYEGFGYESFQFEDCRPGWPGEDEDYTFSQDPEKFQQAREALRNLPVSELYELLLRNNIPGRKALTSLCKKYCDNYDPSMPNDGKPLTLSTLTAAVYNAFKKSKDNKDLTQLYSLFIIPQKYQLAEEKPAYYSNLGHLYYMRFFKKQTNQQVKACEINQTASLK
jgi:hypothetical protein